MPVRQPFVYTPNRNDPELSLLRRRALTEMSRGRGRNVDELARAGLLGSSAALSSMSDFERGGRETLADIDDRVFARQRGEAYDLYRDDLAFQRQKELMEEANSGFRLGALADIGSFLLPGIGSTISGLFNRRKLPTASLQAASELPFGSPNPRLQYY